MKMRMRRSWSDNAAPAYGVLLRSFSCVRPPLGFAVPVERGSTKSRHVGRITVEVGVVMAAAFQAPRYAPM
jgi:hypothetical protein